jgi:hypothetical protein
MPLQVQIGKSELSTAIAIFLLVFSAVAWLAPQVWNVQVVTRLGLTLSIVESGGLDIDRWADRTIDKALFEGHYYADKLPGLSLLAVPVVAAAGHVSEALGRPLNASADEDFMIFAKN